MFKSVLKVLIYFAARYLNIPIIQTYVGKLKGVILEIDSLESLAASVTVGPATDKAIKGEAMIAAAVIVAGAGYAYAVDTGDNTLKGKMDITKSKLEKKLDGEDAEDAQMLYDTINPIVVAGSLTDYGITPTIMGDFQTKINDYADWVETPQLIRKEGKMAREKVKEQIVIGRTTLHNIDKIMPQFDTPINEDFFKAYTESREIYSMGTGHKTGELFFEKGATIAQTLFEKKFKAGDSFLIRNKTGENILAGLAGSENQAPITGTVKIGPYSEIVLLIPKGANIISCRLLSIVPQNIYDVARVTVILSKGKSTSKAKQVELSGIPK